MFIKVGSDQLEEDAVGFADVTEVDDIFGDERVDTFEVTLHTIGFDDDDWSAVHKVIGVDFGDKTVLETIGKTDEGEPELKVNGLDVTTDSVNKDSLCAEVIVFDEDDRKAVVVVLNGEVSVDDLIVDDSNGFEDKETDADIPEDAVTWSEDIPVVLFERVGIRNSVDVSLDPDGKSDDSNSESGFFELVTRGETAVVK